MMLTRAVAEGVARGDVTLAFRRWATSRVSPGGTFLSVAGVIVVDTVERIDPATITPENAHAAGADGVEDVLAALRGAKGDPVFRIALSHGGPAPRAALATDAAPTPDGITRIAGALDRPPAGPAPTCARAVPLPETPPRARAHRSGPMPTAGPGHRLSRGGGRGSSPVKNRRQGRTSTYPSVPCTRI
ncbi:hypothetical protein ACFTTN_20915 [Streptomyces niveus]|uniref:hypothetical protein n=1 Tax=Streptomyces niveus TaxID=193462 RepID=UPI003633D423